MPPHQGRAATPEPRGEVTDNGHDRALHAPGSSLVHLGTGLEGAENRASDPAKHLSLLSLQGGLEPGLQGC